MGKDELMEDTPGEEGLDETEWEDNRKSGCLIKTAAILVLLAFTVFSLPNFSDLLSNKLNFFAQNKVLMQDEIVQRCKPAVVSIEAVDANELLFTGAHRGTGFNVSPTGTIVTNQHIVANASIITITFSDGRKYFSSQYEAIPGVDIAIVKIKGKDLPTLSLDMEDRAENGDMVTIIGNPLGFEKISQRGQVGQFHRIKGSQSLVFDIAIQINPGNSGSPVINNQSQVVGIVFGSTSLDINGKSTSLALAIPVQSLPPDFLVEQDYLK